MSARHFHFGVSVQSRLHIRLKINSRSLLFNSIKHLTRTGGPLFRVRILGMLYSVKISTRLLLIKRNPLSREIQRRTRALNLASEIRLPNNATRPRQFVDTLSIFAVPSLCRKFPVAIMRTASGKLPLLVSGTVRLKSFRAPKVRCLPTSRPQR